ncbi:hypothetical protein Trydic_g556 [Trypoxylus dichotomus]
MIRLMISYAAETRADTSRIKQMMRTTEMSILRMVAGKTRRDRIKNKDVRDRRTQWNDHDHVWMARDQRLMGRGPPSTIEEMEGKLYFHLSRNPMNNA